MKLLFNHQQLRKRISHGWEVEESVIAFDLVLTNTGGPGPKDDCQLRSTINMKKLLFYR